LPYRPDTACLNIPRSHSPPELHISAALLRQIQSPHCTSGQSYACCQWLPGHRETAHAFLPRTCSNTVLLRNAFCFHLSPFFRSEYKAEYHGELHPLPEYNEYHWLPPGQFPVPCSYASDPDLRFSAWESRDPEVPGRNSLFQIFPDNEEPNGMLPHTFPVPDTSAPRRPDRLTGQSHLRERFPEPHNPLWAYNKIHPHSLLTQSSSDCDIPDHSQPAKQDGNTDPLRLLSPDQNGNREIHRPHTR